VTAGLGLHYTTYSAGTSDEWMMRIGPEGAPAILILPPLFEEMNRTRAFLASLMRALARRGFECRLPDLPGTGESERSLEGVTWEDWRQAAKAAGEGVWATVSVRGGALLDDTGESLCQFRISPAEGKALTRDMARSNLGGGGGTAGYPVSEAMLAALAAAMPATRPKLRTVRLSSDPREADAKLEGPALWRRSEPGTAPELAQKLADDIADWIAQCGAS
jgi:hypothetical protein